MTTLIKLTNAQTPFDGKPLYVNPEHVAAIMDTHPAGMTDLVMATAGEFVYRVQEPIEDVIKLFSIWGG